MPSTTTTKPKKKLATSTRRRALKTIQKKAPTDSGRLLPRKIHVVIDGIPITLHAAKGKRTLTAARLRAVMKAVIEGRKKDE